MPRAAWARKPSASPSGHKVAASDISSGAVERLCSELSARGISASLRVDDLRTLSHGSPETMAAVLACDNSVPHLLSDMEILQAFSSCYRCLRPGGLAIFSVRDYATSPRRPGHPPIRHSVRRGRQFLAIQVWEWDADQYDLRVYLTTESPEGICATQVYAVATTQSPSNGCSCSWRRRASSTPSPGRRLFQPVLLARRPDAG